MRKPLVTAAVFSMLPLFVLPAQAQEERYRLERTEDGYVRMDTRTGDMTLCREHSGGLVCRPASESRDAGQPESESLRDRIAELEARVSALEERLEGDVPLQEEFEQSLNLMERFFRRFVDIVRGLEEEEQAPTPPSGGSSAPGERT